MQACQEIVSGVDVVVGTPPSLLRIVKRKILDLKELRHMVSGDITGLQQNKKPIKILKYYVIGS